MGSSVSESGELALVHSHLLRQRVNQPNASTGPDTSRLPLLLPPDRQDLCRRSGLPGSPPDCCLTSYVPGMSRHYPYSFHIWDSEWGHLTIKMAGHPPFGAQVMLNGHEYVACRASGR